MSSATATVVADLLAAASPSGRLDHLVAEGLADEPGLDWLLERARELVHDDPGAADELAQLCQTAAAEHGLSRLEGQASYLRGRVHADRGQLDAALGFIDRARGQFTAAGLSLEALRTDLGRMQVLDDLGRHEEAVAVGEALVSQLSTMVVSPADLALSEWLRAAALENIGVAWSFTGQYQRSLEAYAEAESAYDAMGQEADVSRPRANRGIELLSLGRAREALTVLRDAAAGFTAAGDRLWAAKCEGSIGEAHRQLGDPVRALAVLEPAGEVLDGMGAATETARVRLTIARTWLDLGLHAPALAEGNRAVETYHAANMPHDEAVGRAVVASALLGLGQTAAADKQIRMAAELFDGVNDRLRRAQAMLMQSQAAVLDGRRTDAAALAALASDRLRDGGWRGPLAEALIHRATVTDGDDAQRAIDEAEKLVAQLDLSRLRPQLDIQQARIDKAAGRTARAEQMLRHAIAAVQRTGGTLPDHHLRTAYRSDNTTAYSSLVDLLVERSAEDAREAFWIANRAKSQTLRDLTYRTMGSAAWTGQAGGVGESADVRRDLHAAYVALQNADDPRRREVVQAQARELEARLAAMALRRSATEVAAPSGSQSPVAGGLAVNRPVGTPTLAFHVVDSDVIVFVASGDRVVARRLRGIMPAVDEHSSRLAAQWSRFQMSPRFVERHLPALTSTTDRVLEGLYALLVGPVRDLLDEMVTDELVVVPHGGLGDVPFHALRDGELSLVDRWTITIGPAVTAASDWRWDPSARAVVLAAPDHDAPAVASEARAVQRHLPGATLLVDDWARVSELTTRLHGGVDLVHLACHGIFCAENPLFSRLRLADRWITATELLDLNVSRALVTLSACESARQGATAEPVGLAWALIAAGASGVIVSRWLVHDGVSVLLMDEMYAGLVEGLTPPAALRRAQRKIRKAHPHPFYWAPFSYVARPAEM